MTCTPIISPTAVVSTTEDGAQAREWKASSRLA